MFKATMENFKLGNEKARIWLVDLFFFLTNKGELVESLYDNITVARFGMAPAAKRLVC